jgi:hypothetical protein
MAKTHLYVKAGDERPTLEYTAQRGTVHPQAVDLSNADGVHLYVQNASGDLVIDAAASIDDAANGEISYDFAEDDLFDAGRHDFEFVVSWPDGDEETFPKKGYGVIQVDETLDRTIPASDLGPDNASVDVLTANEVNTDLLGPNNDSAVKWDGAQDAQSNDLQNVGAFDSDSVSAESFGITDTIYESAASLDNLDTMQPNAAISDTSSTSFATVLGPPNFTGGVVTDRIPAGATLYANFLVRASSVPAGETGTYRPRVTVYNDGDQAERILGELQTDVTDTNAALSGWTEITSVDPNNWAVIKGQVIDAMVTGGTLSADDYRNFGVFWEWRVN